MNHGASFCGMSLARMSKKDLLGILSVSAILCSILFAALQEKVFLIDGFKYGGFMAFITTFVYYICAMLERWMSNDMERKGAMRDYALLSFFTTAGTCFTNWSLNYLNYPMRIMFKSSKVIPVMLLGLFILRRKYSLKKWITAGILVSGILAFALGDVRETPKFDMRGVVLILVGVVADAITSNFEERQFFRSTSASHAEVMCFASLFGLGVSGVLLYSSGEMKEGLEHAAKHPEVFLYTSISALAGYWSVVFILLIIKHFDATIAEVVKSVRKVLSIIFSFMLYTKPLNSMHVLGGGLFLVSLMITINDKKKRKHKSKISIEIPLSSVEIQRTDNGMCMLSTRSKRSMSSLCKKTASVTVKIAS